MLKNEKGMGLIPLVLTLFVLLALAGATIFMIGDGILFNKDVKSTVYNENNSVTENTSEDENKVEIKNTITSENS